MNKHTPGPWTVGNESAVVGKGEYERDILTTLPGRGRVRVGTWSHRADAPTEGQANARLIAAAPDLLEVMIQVYRSGVFYEAKRAAKGIGPQRVEYLRQVELMVSQVIAKAEGGATC